MKCRKGLVAGVVAVCMMGAMGSTSVFAVTGDGTKDTDCSTTVKYSVTKGYEWSVPAEIDFESNKGVGENVSVNLENAVKVIKNVIGDKETLNIKIDDEQEFTIENGATTLNYTVKKAGENTDALSKGDKVLSVAAGKNADSVNLVFTLNTGNKTAEVAGNYTGTIKYVASISKNSEN